MMRNAFLSISFLCASLTPLSADPQRNPLKDGDGAVELIGNLTQWQPVSDMARARKFYEGILGLEVTMDHKMEKGHWVEYDIGPATLALGVAPGMNPSPDGCSVSLEVEDFEQAISELQEAGIEFGFGPIETPVCHMAFVKDPDGNSVGIHKRKPGHN